MQATVGRRERKKEATREALIQAAYARFQERGFDAIPIEAIAEAADVSRRTFFRYFPTKEAIVFPRQAERLAFFRRLLEDAPPGMTGVRRACMETAEAFALAREEFMAQGRIIRRSHTLIAYEASLDVQWEDAVSTHLSQTMEPLQARLLAGGIMGLVRAVLRIWRGGDCREDLEALGETAFALLIREETS